MKTAIIIPARYGSTRFPGKPLAKIAGKTMLERVVDIAQAAAGQRESIRVLVATEDRRIADFCAALPVPCVMTSADCPTGSDRILEAARLAGEDFDFIIGLQGDAPFTPPDAVLKILGAAAENPGLAVVTPVVRLRWAELDALRESKKTTPFSGTTAIVGADGQALWFSKAILPAIRDEARQREAGEFSPVFQHIGLYGYRRAALEKFVSLSQSRYERLEGLEQLRLLENGIPVHTVTVDVDAGLAQAGIDSPEDIARAERILAAAP